MARTPDLALKQELLDDVVNYLAHHGLVGMSLRTLATALDTNASRLIHHFGSKEHLLAAALNRANERQEEVGARWLARNPGIGVREWLTKWWKWMLADPENLADEVILRAFRRLEEGVEAHSGVSAYCFGVAEHVLREERRRPQAQELVQEPVLKNPPRSSELTRSEQSILVDEFLSTLTEAERQLIARYYREDRKKLAESEGLSENGLRVRVFRIHQKLQELAAHRMGKKG